MVFGSPVTSPSRQGGSVRVVRFYIGDELETCLNGSVRAVLEMMPDDLNMYNILLDSGADLQSGVPFWQLAIYRHWCC